MDPETSFAEDKMNMFQHAKIRNGFIRKVYSIVMAQLLVTFSIVTVCAYHSGTRYYAQEYCIPLLLTGLIVSFVSIIFMFCSPLCCGEVRRKFPYNLILLCFYTLGVTMPLSVVAANTPPELIVIAIGITIIISFALILFAFQTKYDFTGWGAYLFIGVLVFLIFSVLGIFIHDVNNTYGIVFSGFVVLLFSFHLIYDTQLMIGGKHKYTISPEEYVFAALSIYADIIQIFIRILYILRATR